MRVSLVWMVLGWSSLCCVATSLAEVGTPASRPAYLIPVQIPYNAPPEPEFPEIEQASHPSPGSPF
jgi:hypothetical protein